MTPELMKSSFNAAKHDAIVALSQLAEMTEEEHLAAEEDEVKYALAKVFKYGSCDDVACAIMLCMKFHHAQSELAALS